MEKLIKENTSENPEPTLDVFIAENKQLLGNDRVFNLILATAQEGWSNLSEVKKRKLLDLLNDMVMALKNYHESYAQLKFVNRKSKFYIADSYRYRDKLDVADQREKILHDVFVDSVNILSRQMKTLELDNSWRGDDEIYSTSPKATRVKLKNWMFKIYNVSIES